MNYASISVKVMRELSDAPVIKASGLDRYIHPDRGVFKYDYADGFWIAVTVSVAGPRVLDRLDKDGLMRLGKTHHKASWTSYHPTGLTPSDVPNWVQTLIERYRPEGDVRIPGAH